MGRVGSGLISALVGAFSLACGHGDGITSRVGELHLHQYPFGGHITPLFINPPTPMAEVQFDSALPVLRTPMLVAGDCMVYVADGCVRACLTPPAPIDGGRIDIAGLAQPVTTVFHADFGGYYDDLSFDSDVLTGGTTVQVKGEGSAMVPPFATSLRLPMPITPTSTLASGLQNGLHVAWTAAGDDTRVRIELDVAPSAGNQVSVVCELTDGAQQLDLPDSVRALLPPAPRQLQLEVSRYRLTNVSLGDGRGVVVHGGYSVPSSAQEN
jgi:hypothetical protein